MNNNNVNKLTIFLNLIILFLICFYLINHFFFSKTLVIENKKVEGVVYNNSAENNHPKRKSLSLINVNLPELPNMNFSNSIIKADSKQKKNESEEKETSKIIPIKFKKTLPKQNIVFSLKPIKYPTNLKNIQIKKIKIKKSKVESQDRNKDDDFNKLVDDGNKFLKNKNKDFEIEFSWPKNVNIHNKIYNILSSCLNSQTVLIREDNKVFGLNGLISRDVLNEKFSNIIRVPTNVYSNLEKSKIRSIRNNYLNGNNGKHLRIFLKEIDAFIIGFYLKLAQNKSLKLMDIRGQYKIVQNKLYLDDLIINSIKFQDKISLSSLNKNCII